MYGAGTAVVMGSGAPTAGLVYKLVEVDGRPVAKRSAHKATHGGGKSRPALASRRAAPRSRRSWSPDRRRPADREAARIAAEEPGVRRVAVPLLARRHTGRGGVGDPRRRRASALAASLRSLPWEGLSLSYGEPALATRVVTVR